MISPHSLAVVILAAGAGTRMRSTLPKPLHELGGRPLVAYALRAAEQLDADTTVIVVGHRADDVRRALGDAYTYATQVPQQGTAHAVEVALPHIPNDVAMLLVLFSDTPLVTDETLRLLLATHRTQQAKVTLLTARVADPAAYGRIIRDSAGRVVAIVEAQMATAEQMRVMRSTAASAASMPHGSARCCRASRQTRSASGISRISLRWRSATPTGGAAWPVAAITTSETEAMGINDRVQLAEAEAALRRAHCSD